ncbi:TPA: ATP-dependent Clp protease proteolytic subunit [Enterococcus faecalis]|nr:ATP-dependent Clp protease proteolytic subunit [Enterococcus faecalis]
MNREINLSETPQELLELQNQYTNKLSNYTDRNTIKYYSGFLFQTQGDLSISDNDMTGFMNAVQNCDKSKGLDLILHTPGGSPTAAESIVKYLKKMFNKDIRVIVPHMAMSAGTMIACASKEIVMGSHSSLGPIDPQFNSIPAYNIKAEFEEAEKTLEESPNKAQYWAIKLQQYPAAFLKSAIDAIDLSSTLIKEWLGDAMYETGTDDEKINRIVEALNEHSSSLVHDRHYDIDKCLEIGLKVTALEKDKTLQDLVLSVHHSTHLTMERLNLNKIIANEKVGFFNSN